MSTFVYLEIVSSYLLCALEITEVIAESLLRPLLHSSKNVQLPLVSCCKKSHLPSALIFHCLSQTLLSVLEVFILQLAGFVCNFIFVSFRSSVSDKYLAILDL